MKKTLIAFFKFLVCSLTYYFGTALGALFAAKIHLTARAASGPNPLQQSLLFALTSLILGALLAYLASRLSGRWHWRWLALSAFGWGVYSLSDYLKTVSSAGFSSTSPRFLAVNLIAFLTAGAAATMLFKGKGQKTPGLPWRFPGSVWRLALVGLAFPAISLVAARMGEILTVAAHPLVLVEQPTAGGESSIPAFLLRGLIILASSLGLIAHWNRSRMALWLALTGSIYLLVGGLTLFQATELPFISRGIRCLEVFFNAMGYAGCLVMLLTVKSQKRVDLAPEKMVG